MNNYIEFDMFGTFPGNINVMPKNMTHDIMIDMNPTSHQMIEYGVEKTFARGYYANHKNQRKQKFYKETKLFKNKKDN